jgi:hypothetical protein
MLQLEAESGQGVFGPLTLVAKGVTVDGQVTDEYARPNDDGDLWVNETTDLPVRDAFLRTTNGQTDWSYYAPTPEALAELTLPIPAGYTEVTLPAGATSIPSSLPPSGEPVPASNSGSSPSPTTPASNSGPAPSSNSGTAPSD